VEKRFSARNEVDGPRNWHGSSHLSRDQLSPHLAKPLLLISEETFHLLPALLYVLDFSFVDPTHGDISAELGSSQFEASVERPRLEKLSVWIKSDDRPQVF